MARIASQMASNAQPRSSAIALTEPSTSAWTAYTGRHQRCSMARPRSVASQGERRLSVTAMSAGCTAPSGECEVSDEQRPAGHAHAELGVEGHLGERLPERLDERGDEEEQ